MGLPALRPMPLLLIRPNQSHYVLFLLGEFARLVCRLVGVTSPLMLVDLSCDVAQGGSYLLVGFRLLALAIELYFCQICFKA